MGDSKAGRSRLALLIDNLTRYLFVISSFERKLILAPRRMEDHMEMFRSRPRWNRAGNFKQGFTMQ